MSRIIGKIGTKIAQVLGVASVEVIDRTDVRHRLAEELGRGGQGAVYRTTNREIAVKLLIDAKGDPVTDANGPAADELVRSIERVLALPLPQAGIAVPLAPLKGTVGYTMRLLDGMQPLARLMSTKGDPAAHYAATGGLRRRLELLARLADRLAVLHGSGLVFSDLSPNNVFVSSDAAFSEVWLIDADNLHYLEQRELRVYTPRYGAPEVVSGQSPVNTLTDCWSFAVIAHELLRMVHPFEGGAAEQSGWDVTASGIAPKPESPLAWIDDPSDASNRSSHGRTLDATATLRMKALFERAFCAGRLDPLARPAVAEWADALWEAFDLVVVCSECKGSTFVRAQGRTDCRCGRRMPVLRIESRLWLPDLDEDLHDLAQGRRGLIEMEESLQEIDPDRAKSDWKSVVLPQRPPIATMRTAVGAEAVIPMSMVGSVGVEGRRTPAITLRVLGTQLVLEPHCDSAGGWKWIDPRTGREAYCTSRIEVKLPSSNAAVLHLHCGTVGEPHRVLSIVHLVGGGDAG